VYMWVNGVQRMNNTSWNTPTSSGPITLPTGWHDIEVRFSNGGGGAGANPVNTWTSTFGFGYRINSSPTDPLATSIQGSDYTPLIDNGAGNTFRSASVDGNSLVKTGNGTLSLTGANTFTRNIAINGGTLAPANVAALGATATISTDGGSLGLPAAGGFTLPALIALSLWLGAQ